MRCQGAESIAKIDKKSKGIRGYFGEVRLPKATRIGSLANFE